MMNILPEMILLYFSAALPFIQLRILVAAIAFAVASPPSEGDISPRLPL